ncbi:Serine protease SPPA, chloroplastic [Galdieria sulphuraria]|nr:Serine protease SPPA, chloroplastic [Galdieria sulphuraria]
MAVWRSQRPTFVSNVTLKQPVLLRGEGTQKLFCKRCSFVANLLVKVVRTRDLGRYQTFCLMSYNQKDPSVPQVREGFVNNINCNIIGAIQAHRMSYKDIGFLQKVARTLGFMFSLRRRISRGSVLQLEITGSLPDALASPLDALSVTSIVEVTSNIRKAAHDPRIAALFVKLGPLSCGYAKVAELCRHFDYFRQTGKKIIGYMEIGSEKEILLSLFMDELYAAPEAGISIRGFKVSATFLKGLFQKIGLEPQVERLGVYKFAGDQFSRTAMSNEQREVLKNILQAVYENFRNELSTYRNWSQENVDQVLNSAPFQMSDLKNLGFFTDLKYESEVLDLLKLRYCRRGKGVSPSDSMETKEKILRKPFRFVNSKYYSRVKAKQLFIEGENPLIGSTVGSNTLVSLIRQAAENPKFDAFILRVDSPGGSALASDIIWAELLRLRQKKPIVASMSDVAASGGYYISMACNHICCEPLTLTGSIGVVTAKFSLENLYKKIGFVKETVSIGRYAEVDIESRSFNEDERQYFKNNALHAYQNFVSKAAKSRGKTYEELDSVAQGRVWLGFEALQLGLVDSCGGFWKAVEVAKVLANIGEHENVQLVELRRFSWFSRLAASFLSSLESFGLLLPKYHNTQGLRLSPFGDENIKAVMEALDLFRTFM